MEPDGNVGANGAYSHQINSQLQVVWIIISGVPFKYASYVWAPTQATEIRGPLTLILGCSATVDKLGPADWFTQTIGKGCGPTCTESVDSGNVAETHHNTNCCQIYRLRGFRKCHQRRPTTWTRGHVSCLRILQTIGTPAPKFTRTAPVSVEILVFPRPTGYMLTSLGLSFWNWRVVVKSSIDR